MTQISSKMIMPVALADVGGALYSFVYSQFIRSYERAYDGTNLNLYGIDPNIQPTYAQLFDLVTNGGSFEGIKLGIELTSSGATRIVPAVVPGSTYVDENEVTQTRTWAEWATANTLVTVYQHTSNEPFIFKAVWIGTLLNSEALAAADAQTGVSVIEWADFTSRVDSVDYDIYIP